MPCWTTQRASKNRHRRFRDSDPLRKLFDAAVQRCIAEGIGGGEGFAVDASMIPADAHRRRGVASGAALDTEHASRAVPESLRTRDQAA
jgi:transposase